MTRFSRHYPKPAIGFESSKGNMGGARYVVTWSLSVGSVLLGLVESFLYGVYPGLVFTPIYNSVSRWWER